jgi:hypothetical protein
MLQYNLMGNIVKIMHEFFRKHVLVVDYQNDDSSFVMYRK